MLAAARDLVLLQIAAGSSRSRWRLVALLHRAASKPRRTDALGRARRRLLLRGDAMTYASDLLFTCNVEILHKTPKLAEELVRRAGPSEGRWRLLSTEHRAVYRPLRTWADLRPALSHCRRQLIDVLGPQLEALFHIEGAAPYFSLFDDPYLSTMNLARPNFNKLFDVRFVFSTRARCRLSQRGAEEMGFKKSWKSLVARENAAAAPRVPRVARGHRPRSEGTVRW